MFAKHHWLGPSGTSTDCKCISIRWQRSTHLSDARAEGKWRVGFRVHVAGEHDPDEPTFKGQFGMTKDECTLAAARLRAEGVDVEGIHFHLRSNVETPAHFGQAIREIKNVCARAAIEPRYLDCGGGGTFARRERGGRAPAAVSTSASISRPCLTGVGRSQLWKNFG